MCRIVTTLIFVMALAAVGEAQELTIALSAYNPFGIDDLDGELPLSTELRLTVPISDRFAVEPFVTAGKRNSDRGGTEGFYGMQLRQRIVRLTNGYAFATYGLAGYYSSSGYAEPVIGHFGLGLNQQLSKHLAFRPEVHLVTFHVVPIGARFAVGLSVSPGH